MNTKKINGYQLRQAIKRWALQREIASGSFKDSLYSFEGDEKDTPEGIMLDFEQSDNNMARLEELQQIYNQFVTCHVLNQSISLARCVKLVGGAGRREKMWREALLGKKDRYSYNDDSRERDSNKEYAKRTISAASCSANAKQSAQLASAIRNAIASGNATEVDIEKLGLSVEEFYKLFQ